MMLGWFGTAHPALQATYTYAGEAESPDGKAHVIDVKNADGFAARLFIDQNNYLPLMVTYKGRQPRVMTSGGPMYTNAAAAAASRRTQTKRADADEERKKLAADTEKMLTQQIAEQPAGRLLALLRGLAAGRRPDVPAQDAARGCRRDHRGVDVHQGQGQSRRSTPQKFAVEAK